MTKTLRPIPGKYGRINGRMQDHAVNETDESLTVGRRIGPNMLDLLEEMARNGGRWSRRSDWYWGTVENTERALQRLWHRGAVVKCATYEANGLDVYRLNLPAILNASYHILPSNRRDSILRSLNLGW